MGRQNRVLIYVGILSAISFSMKAAVLQPQLQHSSAKPSKFGFPLVKTVAPLLCSSLN